MSVICAHCDRRSEGWGSCEHCGEDPELQGRYVLEKVVGEGASGTTYRARDAEEERPVAIKEMGIHGMETFKAHELFEREADVLCRLEHPGIPTFYDYFEWGEGKALRFYLVMEFVEGKTLLEELNQRQYTVETARDVVWQLGEIARYLHGLSPPVIHRDIKPSNVLRRPDGELVLIDFGSVRDALEADKAGSTIAGTIGYMAPEQLRGEATPASDVYGIGATVIHLLTRCEPSELLGPTNQLEWEEKIDLTPNFAWLIGKMLAADPADRLSDGNAVMKALVEMDLDDDVSDQIGSSEALSPWGVATGGEVASPPPKQSLNAEQLEQTPDYDPRESGSFKASMIVLLIGVAVMGIFCGGWLTLSTSPDESSHQSTDARVGEDPGIGGADEDFGNIDIDEILRGPKEIETEGESSIDEQLEQMLEEISAQESPSDTSEDENLDESEPVESLSRSDVLDEMNRHTYEFRDCNDGSVEGRHLQVRFQVERSGHVTSAELLDGDVSDELYHCVRAVFDRMKFPAAEQSQTINYPVPMR